MNIIAHGLWGVALTPKKDHKKHVEAIFWSVFPDLLWGWVTIPYLLFRDFGTDWTSSPSWFYHLYGLGHSAVIWLAVGGTLFAVRRFRWPILFWLFHIVVDILGHTSFSTPFLYPLSRFSWTSPFSWTDLVPETLSFFIPVAIIAWKYRLMPKRL